jgi:2-keto-4-pentenoate hydratase/2-oxohepta-3-ene-1,7-dioic acid hydratase in catechol pathway
MKLCRHGPGRVGVIRGDAVHDVSSIVERLPRLGWPYPTHDVLIAHLETLRGEMEKLADRARPQPLAEVELLSPVANPGKVVVAGTNYADHIAEAARDQTIAHGRQVNQTLEEKGVFVKASSSIVGPSQGVAQRFPERRNDHEVELCAVIGRAANRVSRERALDYVAGYTIGLDMTVRGTEHPGLRKSIDSYTVLGPCLVTADEIGDPQALELKLWVNGEQRQGSNTRTMISGVARLIEYASQFYTLHPGDVLMTGTPAGVSPVKPGDVMEAEIERIGRMRVAVRLAL